MKDKRRKRRSIGTRMKMGTKKMKDILEVLLFVEVSASRRLITIKPVR